MVKKNLHEHHPAFTAATGLALTAGTYALNRDMGKAAARGTAGIVLAGTVGGTYKAYKKRKKR